MRKGLLAVMAAAITASCATQQTVSCAPELEPPTPINAASSINDYRRAIVPPAPVTKHLPRSAETATPIPYEYAALTGQMMPYLERLTGVTPQVRLVVDRDSLASVYGNRSAVFGGGLPAIALRNTIYINPEYLPSDIFDALRIVSHELVHLTQPGCPNEECVAVNEGLAELGAYMMISMREQTGISERGAAIDAAQRLKELQEKKWSLMTPSQKGYSAMAVRATGPVIERGFVKGSKHFRRHADEYSQPACALK